MENFDKKISIQEQNKLIERRLKEKVSTMDIAIELGISERTVYNRKRKLKK